MKDNDSTFIQLFTYIGKSKFIRSFFLETVSVFLVIILMVVVIMIFTFGAEINKNMVAEQKNQLDAAEGTLSERMEEVTSIAYNVGQDPMFYLEPIAGIKYSGYEMSSTLSRYLVGNKFIEYLAYYRISEPDMIYTSTGELTFRRFWDSCIGSADFSETDFLESIKGHTGVQFMPLFVDSDIKFFAYACPLPQFSTQPKAFVFAFVPLEDISAPLHSQLAGVDGKLSLYDAHGNVIFEASTLDEAIPAQLPAERSKASHSELRLNGRKYSVLTKTSSVNGWTYVSVVRLNSVLSQLANQQIGVILSLIFIMISAVFVILLGVIKKYRPISNLAMTLTSQTEQSSGDGMVDEKTLLTSTIATLKSDSEQKHIFEAAYQEANEASRAKSIFLSNMSHDIRTPMNAIIGMMDLAQKHINDTEYVASCLQKADVASHYLLELINNVLDMSRIESGKITLSEELIRLPEFTASLITIIRPSIRARHQRLIVDTDGVRNDAILGDTVRLTQICMNILSNAVKFTPDAGTIRIELREKASADAGFSVYEFVFSDSGMGMPPDYVSRVFDMFSRANESVTSKIEGTGLGMAITKNLVDLMGGTITCSSELDKGTVFAVTLRMKLADDEPAADDAQQNGSGILLFAEDADVLLHQSALLNRLGLRVSCASSADNALELLTHGTYELALFDLLSDEKKDLDELLTLISKAKRPQTRFILAAADFSELDKSAAVSAGADRFIRLPLFYSTFLNMLKYPDGFHETESDDSDVVLRLDGKRILLAEDNETNRALASTFIEETGAEVFEAVNGKAALETFAKHPVGFFDVILMDVKMPVMDGLTATAAIRKLDRPDASNVPIFAMTANTFDEDVSEVLKSGMNGHLGKPYTSDDLYKLLEGVLTSDASAHE